MPGTMEILFGIAVLYRFSDDENFARSLARVADSIADQIDLDEMRLFLSSPRNQILVVEAAPLVLLVLQQHYRRGENNEPHLKKVSAAAAEFCAFLAKNGSGQWAVPQNLLGMLNGRILLDLAKHNLLTAEQQAGLLATLESPVLEEAILSWKSIPADDRLSQLIRLSAEGVYRVLSAWSETPTAGLRELALPLLTGDWLGRAIRQWNDVPLDKRLAHLPRLSGSPLREVVLAMQSELSAEQVADAFERVFGEDLALLLAYGHKVSEVMRVMNLHRLDPHGRYVAAALWQGELRTRLREETLPQLDDADLKEAILTWTDIPLSDRLSYAEKLSGESLWELLSKMARQFTTQARAEALGKMDGHVLREAIVAWNDVPAETRIAHALRLDNEDCYQAFNALRTESFVPVDVLIKALGRMSKMPLAKALLKWVEIPEAIRREHLLRRTTNESALHAAERWETPLSSDEWNVLLNKMSGKSLAYALAHIEHLPRRMRYEHLGRLNGEHLYAIVTKLDNGANLDLKREAIGRMSGDVLKMAIVNWYHPDLRADLFRALDAIGAPDVYEAASFLATKCEEEGVSCASLARGLSAQSRACLLPFVENAEEARGLLANLEYADVEPAFHACVRVSLLAGNPLMRLGKLAGFLREIQADLQAGSPASLLCDRVIKVMESSMAAGVHAVDVLDKLTKGGLLAATLSRSMQRLSALRTAPRQGAGNGGDQPSLF